jgi:hypothetical protein
VITAHEGALAGRFVGQERIAAAPGVEDPQLFYWAREARNANAELDFVISWRSDLLPVEVKAGKTGSLDNWIGCSRRRSLHNPRAFWASSMV